MRISILKILIKFLKIRLIKMTRMIILSNLIKNNKRIINSKTIINIKITKIIKNNIKKMINNKTFISKMILIYTSLFSFQEKN